MHKIIGHIVNISAHKDRTEIISALMNALSDLFAPAQLAVYRCYQNSAATLLFCCAEINERERYSRNAYFPDRRFCIGMDKDPVLLRCYEQQLPINHPLLHPHTRLVFPITQEHRVLYLVDITLPEDFPIQNHLSLAGLLNYFNNHLNLLDYGESDSLTGLATRKTFEKHLFHVLGSPSNDFAQPGTAGTDPESPIQRRLSPPEARHWLVVIDVDRFKLVNDTYGHVIGDEVLVTLAQIIENSFRFDDQFFRFGGEEFVIILQPTSKENALKALERFRHNVANHQFNQVGKVTVTLGLTRLFQSDTPTQAVSRADEALYYGKQHGRDQVVDYDELLDKGLVETHHTPTGDIELF